MLDISDSSYYETTYSEDERIDQAIRRKNDMLRKKAQDEDLARQELYEHVRQEESLDIFKLPGLKIIAFRHLKIKFSFHPAVYTKYVNKNCRFYVSLRYVKGNWRVKRDSLPVNYKWKIYSLFYGEDCFVIDDDNIVEVIDKIYQILVRWAEKEEVFRIKKFQRYLAGAELELDSDDEIMFLTRKEREELEEKRWKILKRMLPPKNRSRQSLSSSPSD